MTQNLIPIVEEFAAQWGKGWEPFLQSYRDYFAPDCVYIAQQNMPATTGADAACELLGPFNAMGVEAIEVEFSKIVQVGDDVWTERIDYMVNKAGERYLPVPIGGVFTFNADGKIVRWADYWDPREILATVPAAE